MGTNDNYSLMVFKWLVTIMSLVIIIPALFDGTTRIAFILTSCVYIFSKFIDNIEGISKYRDLFRTFCCIMGSIVGAIAVGMCFYYFAAIFNETKFVSSVNTEAEVEVDVSTMDTLFPNIEMETDSKQGFSNVVNEELSLDVDMNKYPLFAGYFFYYFLFGVWLFYFFEETFFAGRELCKYFNTKKKLISNRKRNKTPTILNIEL